MQEVDKIKDSIKEAETEVTNSMKVLELVQHPLFQEIIVQGYLTQGLDELLEDRVDPTKQSPSHQLANTRNIDAIAVFKGWLNRQLEVGSNAETRILALKHELVIAEAEELEDNL